MPQTNQINPTTNLPFTPQSPKWSRPSAQLTGLLLAAVILTVFQIILAYNLVITYNRDPGTDMNLFLRFGRLVLDGKTPYQTYQPAEGAFRGELRFIYLFWVIFFYLPFAALETDLALHLWLFVNLVVLFGAVVLAWKTFLPNLSGYWLLPLYCLALAVCSNGIINGHITTLMLLGFAASAYLMRWHRYFVAGLPAFILLIKPQLTFLVGLTWLALLFLHWFKRSEVEKLHPSSRILYSLLLRWFGGAIAGAFVITIISLVVQPDWLFRYLGAFNFVQVNGQVQADGTFLEFYKSIMPSWLEFLLHLEQPWLGLVSGVGLMGLLILGGWRLWQWRYDPPVYLALALAVNLAVTPYSHVYDFPPLVLPLFLILARIRQDWQAGFKNPALLRAGLLALLFLIQPFSADYRWFYSQALGIALLVLSFGPHPASEEV